jgi:hypothetical protein
MNFTVSHIFREKNYCANNLGNIGLSIIDFSFWNHISSYIVDSYQKNKPGLPIF